MMKQYFRVVFVFMICTACSLPGTSSLEVLSPLDSFAYDITFSLDGRLLAIGTLDDGAKIWCVVDKSLVASLGDGDIRAIAFSPDGQFLVTGGGGGEDSTVCIWRVADGSLIRTLDPSLTSWVQSVDVSPDGSQIAVGTNEHVHLFNFADGSLRHTFDSYGMQVAFSPDGHQLAIAENLPVIRIWNLDNYEELYTLPGHGFSIAYSSDGTLFAAPGWNNQGMAAFLGAEKFATTAGGENEVQVWNMVNGNHVRAMNTHRLSRVSDGNEVASVRVGNNVDSVAFSPDGTTVAIGIYKTLYLWPIENAIKKK